ncbi:hypothetical protein [Moritella sp. F3]|uniref:hypothetical protein n=1 Tax=Moritella sp. F3 TaxID=2718882 RepID=UPI0018E0D64D|nr:hypothetical protein [Moritella sp. F3]GIC77620.1 hypothetical protein FMO001_23470 [Moritella sp. F1]GIC82033.1 hypothetical protein FMO003_23140 [Moritella sp. F3]
MDEEQFVLLCNSSKSIVLDGYKADEIELKTTGVSLSFNCKEFWLGFSEIQFGTFDEDELILSNVECKTLARKVDIEFQLHTT